MSSDTFSKVQVITGVAGRRAFWTELKLAVFADLRTDAELPDINAGRQTEPARHPAIIVERSAGMVWVRSRG